MKNGKYIHLLTIISIFFLAMGMSACGGGGGGSISGNIATGTEVFTGTETNAGNTYSATLSIDPLGKVYSFIASAGNAAGGSYTENGSSISLTNGNDYIYPCSTSSCLVLSVNPSNVTINGNELSGTVSLSNGATDSYSLTSQSVLNQTSISSIAYSDA